MTAPTKENKRFKYFTFNEEIKMHDWINKNLFKIWEMTIERFPHENKTVIKYSLEYNYQEEKIEF